MSDNLQTLPVSAFYSTNLNSRIKSFEDLRIRIAHTLGYPHAKIEAHENQVNDNISIALEWFSKYAGFTREYLVFNSELYKPGEGINVDTMVSMTPRLRNPGSGYKLDGSLTEAYKIGNMVIRDSNDDVPPALNSFRIGDDLIYTEDPNDRGKIQIPAGWDDLLGDYRRVVDCFALEIGTSSGINTLFTVEQTLAQQTYFSYSMGNYGFDLVSWYILKNWLDTRSKILSQEKYFEFDKHNQKLHIIPEPSTSKTDFYAAVGCYVEKPIRHMIHEHWVYKYALALTKLNIAMLRGKYNGTSLFGGGAPNYQMMETQGLAEQQQLELMMTQGSAAGYGDAEPPLFFVG
jgi:hypothetical protein